eukprot:10572442-Karenia_brevis.AAC.1
MYIDCQGTLDCVHKGEGYATQAANERAHMWCRYWGQYHDEEVTGIKTKAHATEADVDAGRTTWWELKGNKHADRLAKKGVAMHAPPPEEVKLVKALRQIVKEARKWAGEHESWLHSRGLKDSMSISDPPLKVSRHGHEETSLELYWPSDHL